jgi:hypothetical protein
MGILTRLFGARADSARDLEQLRARLESFMRPSTALVDSRQLTIPAQRERFAAYVYGAATALAETRGLGDTESLALLVMFLRGSSRMTEQEVSYLVGRAMALAREPEGAAVHDAGAQALTEWLAGDAGTAVGRLAESLRHAATD